jgi:hypothetical protein
MEKDDQAGVTYVRKRLYVTDDKAPAMSIDSDGYVRCGLSAKMTESDMIMLGIVLSLKNKEWKVALLERVKEKMSGASTETSKITRAFELIKG